MAKKNKIYTTLARRWGEFDNHTYIIYMGWSKSKAITSGEQEMDDRGGKYSYEVCESTPDDKETVKTIISSSDTYKKYHDGLNPGEHL